MFSKGGAMTGYGSTCGDLWHLTLGVRHDRCPTCNGTWLRAGSASTSDPGLGDALADVVAVASGSALEGVADVVAHAAEAVVDGALSLAADVDVSLD
jgi:hypothetical protein